METITLRKQRYVNVCFQESYRKLINKIKIVNDIMNDFNRCNKVSGVHWLKKPVEDIQIKIKLKPKDGILSLPKFEDYANESNNVTLKQLETEVEEYNLKWQEKVFSVWEMQRYSDAHNCLTDTELNYNEMLNSRHYEHSKIFTYIHEDYHLPLPGDLKKINSKLKVPSLNLCLERLSLHENVSRMFGEDTSSLRHLFRSEENICEGKEQWIAMHVVFDNSEYNNDSQLLLKQEAMLLSLFYNASQKYLVISPDLNNMELNPYTVESASGLVLGYHYSIDVSFEEGESGGDLMILLNNLYKKWERKHRQALNFAMPPLGRKHYYITTEIVTAKGFDGDNLYIEFNINLPENIRSSDTLHGRTHVSAALRDDDVDEWHFGHVVELNLEAPDGLEALPLQVFFEVISTDWWGRHRTEGYTYLPLTLDPGNYTKQLSCSRPEELDGVEAANRRFFVGGCHLIRNLDILTKAQLQDVNFKYTTTGTLMIRWNVISQAPLPGSSRSAPLPSVSSANALLLGAEAVLRQYKRARARLAAATEGLHCDKAKGDGVPSD